LFNQLNLPKAELDVLAQSFLQAKSIAASSKSDASVPLLPKRVADLAWLGLTAATLQTLDPFVTLLPERTPVNLNTAPPEVLMAVLPGLDLAQARQLVQLRSVKPFDRLEDVQRVAVNPNLHFDPTEHVVSSGFFGVVGQLRLGQNTLQERSVLQRVNSAVTVLSRAKEVLTTPVAPLQ
jgi:general secretion pathway protein K